MALSNKAIPRYYGEFREQVLNGEIPVCQEISQEMNRIDDLIANPNIYYDDKAIDGFIAFVENELTLTDGSDVHMLPTFKLWAEQLLSWYYFIERSVYVPGEGRKPGHYERRTIKRRLINKQYLIVARGAAKSMYIEQIQAYFLTVDTSTTHQVVTAPTMVQSEETMAPFRTAIQRAKGPLFQFMTQGSVHNTTGDKASRPMLASTKKGIQNFVTNSLLEVRPMTIDKLQGLRNKISTVDEWLSGDIKEDVIGALEQGATKGDNQDDYIILAVSSEGTVRNGPGDTIKLELAKILRGEYRQPHTSIFWYKLDDVKEVDDPDTWLKAQPNLGKTVSYETYQSDVERAENAPASRNDILAKRFGIPAEGYTYFFTYEETIPHKSSEFWGMPCSLGLDLSQGDDFCGFTFMFPLGGGQFGVKTRSYITSRTLMKLQPAMRMKYEEFINEGTLHIMDGTTLDMMDVFDDVDRHIVKSQYDVRTVGYDPYNAKAFIERYILENGPFGVEKVIQGARTESVPLGELKHMSEDRMLYFDELLMQFAMGNCVVLEDTNGNRKLLKNRYDEKIDNVSALMDAYIAYVRNPEAFE